MHTIHQRCRSLQRIGIKTKQDFLVTYLSALSETSTQSLVCANCSLRKLNPGEEAAQYSSQTPQAHQDTDTIFNLKSDTSDLLPCTMLCDCTIVCYQRGSFLFNQTWWGKYPFECKYTACIPKTEYACHQEPHWCHCHQQTSCGGIKKQLTSKGQKVLVRKLPLKKTGTLSA